MDTVTVSSEAFQVATWLLGALITVCGIVAWWGFRSLMRRFDLMTLKLDAVSDGHVGMKTWQVAHDKQDDGWRREELARLASIDQELLAISGR